MDLGTTKYIIYAELIADGYVEKHDVIGAIFGQTEGLLGDELDLRELQKSGRIGRIDVELENVNGKSIAKITVPSSLDRVETSILAATLEAIDRVGPCVATVRVINIEDIRATKRQYIINRAKEILRSLVNSIDVHEITEAVKESVRMEEVIEYGENKLPAGPGILNSDSIIIVEGRADVLNLLRCGIKNVIAVEGTSVPKTVMELTKKKITTVFTDGDRGGELILKELLQTCDIDYVARAPCGKEVEELSKKEIIKCLRAKVPAGQVKMQLFNNVKNGTTNDNVVIINAFKSDENNKNKIVNKDSNDVVEISPKIKNDDVDTPYLDIARDIIGTNKVKVIIDGNEEIKEFEEFMNEINNIEKIDAVILDMLITQKIVDNLYEKTNLIIGRDIKVTKKPTNLRLLSFSKTPA
ncbi:DNA primase DnaG [Methanotorris formicicus]|uniref:DNA primase DnaG n=1 Tax=Methanotorris formicicus Mc-S-70 TaxID=647171 RepID=H1KZI6_9EURY|nr:DNA primase DnaG [Methanotorris formicicus]EHP85879.1 TOPRIM domain-containing protein [Methanotorris formicicus Mc-S-70]